MPLICVLYIMELSLNRLPRNIECNIHKLVIAKVPLFSCLFTEKKCEFCNDVSWRREVKQYTLLTVITPTNTVSV